MLVDELILHALGHAPYDADDESSLALASQSVESVEASEDALLGIVAHAASVDKDGVGSI